MIGVCFFLKVSTVNMADCILWLKKLGFFLQCGYFIYVDRYMYKKILALSMSIIGLGSFVFGASWKLPGISIITRAQWWANETWRYASTSKTDRDALRAEQQDAQMQQLLDTDVDAYLSKQKALYQSQMATDFLIETTPNEQTVDEYRESSNGNYLKWPESIHKNKSKIIIHHTADDYTSLLTGGTGAIFSQIQAIYKYHTLTRWRWDIGYNFLIDPLGNIYEGRAWGEGVVGAHVSRNNTPTVGISLMGNFNFNVPTDASLKSLVKLTTALAKKYAINPKATATYFKTTDDAPYLKTYTNYTIAGHTDAGVTSCPWTNLYALLPDIRSQVSKNLTTTSLVQSPSAPALSSSSKRGVVVAGRYYSPKTSDTFVLPIRWDAVTTCTTTDASIIIDECYSQDYQLHISLTRKGQWWLKTIQVNTSAGTKTFSMNLFWQKDFTTLARTNKNAYMTMKNISSSSQNITKIASKITRDDIASLMWSSLNVLLYELSTNFTRYEISCDGWCKIETDTTTYIDDNPVIEVTKDFIYLNLLSLENPISVQNISLSSVDGWLVRINNYTRKSYAWIPRNSFRGKLLRKKDSIKILSSSTYTYKPVVINQVSFDNYMKGIAETSDTDAVEKQRTVLLLAKMYALFYLGGDNIHPSIPAGVAYQAIDNPDMFQKYVWAGREKTSKMSARLWSDIHDMVVLYDDYVPILPYFSCSAGFTWSAKEKRWRTDTPYLQSTLDFAACFDFNGHGVGLSGKWAQYLATKWWSMEQILSYYYPGVEVVSL